MNSRMAIAVPSVGLVPVAKLYSCGIFFPATEAGCDHGPSPACDSSPSYGHALPHDAYAPERNC